MQRIETSLPEVCIIQPVVHEDPRGFFFESYRQDKFAELGIHAHFVQENQSRSGKDTLRGLHYQLNFPQAKLCRVLQGEVLDVAVDIRQGSPTFGQWVSVVLSAENRYQLFIPRGFAHGYRVLSETAEFLYLCDEIYHPEDDRGISWADPTLNIDWDIETPILSNKDSQLPQLAQMTDEQLPLFLAHQTI